MSRLAAGVLAVPLVLVSACGETVQTVPTRTAKAVDGASWQVRDNGYVVPGWTPGNEASWDAQLKKRAQAQNDFAKPEAR